MRIGGGVVLLLAIIFTISSANAGPPTEQDKQAFCEAYASAAITTVNEALRDNCARQDTGRWNPSFDDNLNACLNWAKDPRNGGMIGMNETFFRALNLSNCLFGQANVAPTWGGGAFTGDDAPTLDSFCRAYAYIATQQTAGAFACGFDTTKGRFDVNFEHHRLACMGWGSQAARNAGQTAANEITGRTKNKVACAQRLATNPPPPPPPLPPPAATVTVLLDSDVYTNYDPKTGQASGKQPHILRAGTPGVTLLQSDPPYFDLQWPGGSGWVYSGQGYEALQLP